MNDDLRWYREINALAFSDMGSFFQSDYEGTPRLVEIETLTPEQRAAIQKLKVKHTPSTGRTEVKITLHSKAPYLKMLDDEITRREQEQTNA